MRQLGEVRAFEHLFQGLHQVGVGTVDRGRLLRHVRHDLRIEIVVVVAQTLEQTEIFKVIDRGQHLAELTEFLTLVGGGEFALLAQGGEKVALADRNELVDGTAPGGLPDIGHGAV
jgi:hypothetical protein